MIQQITTKFRFIIVRYGTNLLHDDIDWDEKHEQGQRSKFKGLSVYKPWTMSFSAISYQPMTGSLVAPSLACTKPSVSVGVCFVSGGRLVNTYCELHFRSIQFIPTVIFRNSPSIQYGYK